MSLDAHLVELKKRHGLLEQKIEDATAHPSSSVLEISALKKKKLSLKDEIARLSIESMSH